ncbi:hypothetical protein [Nocardioides sp. GY 10127]|uniref:hypothetical protein n=1 Tax=Nocardioides sp. GY 10127 TaxID=2569762 RepID=UPI0010A908BD|nr:hypothetical protein [Nocardioides sp. GY 10127]TIC82605.1 hypothetical protein E8D37_07770 [Nocardioides sp. GY 10127]
MIDPDSSRNVHRHLDAPPPAALAAERDPEAGLRATYTFLIATMVVLGLGLVLGTAMLGAAVLVTVVAAIVLVAGMSSARTWALVGTGLLGLALLVVLVS